MSAIVELFGHSVEKAGEDWSQIIREQNCIFLGKKCYKVRKSDPDIAIGSCTVSHGKRQEPIIICPARLTARRQIFTDCLHLLTTHEPGNELHIVPEVSVPGGSVDYFLVSAKYGKVKDFVGIELQSLDTTGTVWPARQRLLQTLRVLQEDDVAASNRPYGMNWKMTAKTTLVQMHHKIKTFEHVQKRLVLVVQDQLLNYMSREFDFRHLRAPAVVGDSMHLHAYAMDRQPDHSLKLMLHSRLSTDAAGVSACLGLQADTSIELQQIFQALQAKLSSTTLFVPFGDNPSR